MRRKKTKRFLISLLGVILLLSIIPYTGYAAVPQTINYQGYLMDSGGNPVNGTRQMTFSIYDGSSGGTALWTETHNSVAVNQGVYSVVMGSVDKVGNPLDLPFDTQYWLGVEVGTDGEMTPRQILTSVPYALNSETSDYAYNVANNSVNTLNIVDASITETKISTGAVTDSKISGEISSIKIQSAGLDADTVDGMHAAEIIDTASTNSIPSGFFILGESTSPPSGYTFTGGHVVTKGMAWSSKTPMSVPRRFYYETLASANGRIYIMSGQEEDAGGTPYLVGKVDEYDPVEDTWTTSKAEMPTPRWCAASAEIEGLVYVLGGRDDTYAAKATVEAYDAVFNTWSSKANLLAARMCVRAVVAGGKLYALGGENESGPVHTIEVYDPDTNTWSLKSDTIILPKYFGAAALNNKIYILGGRDDTTYARATVDEYDIDSNKWTTKRDMPTPRSSFNAVVVNGKIYVIGGYDMSINYISVVEEYDPITDSWVSKENVPMNMGIAGASEANWYGGAVVVNNTIYNMQYFEFSSSKVFYNNVFDHLVSTLYIHRKN